MSFDNDPFASDSTPAISFKNAAIGEAVTGVVAELPKMVQATDFDSGKPAFWDNGNPKMTVVTTLDVGGELRGLWAPKPSAMFAAFGAAQKELGRKVQLGDVVTVAYIGERANEKNPRLNPQKLYDVSIRAGAPGASGDPFAETPTPAAQAPAPAAPVAPAPAPAAPAPTVPVAAAPSASAATPSASLGPDPLAQVRQLIQIGWPDAKIAGQVGFDETVVAMVRADLAAQ